MNHALPIIVLAVLSFSAVAQEEFSITFGDINGTVTTGAVLSVEVFGDSTFGTHMMGGGFGVSAITNNFEILDMNWSNAGWSAFNTDGGHNGGGNYESVIFWQLLGTGVPPFDQPATGSEIGNRIGTFQIEVGQLGSFWSLDLQIVEVASFPFSLEVLENHYGIIMNDTQGNLTLGSASVEFIPAPSGLVTFCIADLAATRRRR